MAPTHTAPLIEHIRELRKRILVVLVFVALGGAVGYMLHDTLLRILQMPLHDTLYYTTPTGAFSFIIKLCAVFGIIVALPVLSYHMFAFFGPVIARQTKRSFLLYVSMSILLAVAGVLFAYFVSLPAALHFLVNFGGDADIQSLITANEYFNFVLAYVAGFAVLFQVPLIITFINRFTPLPPKKLLGATKFVVLGSFIIAAIITPTPDPFNQALMAVPIVILYLFSIGIVALQRTKRPKEKAAVPVAQQTPAEPVFTPPQVTPRVNVISDFQVQQQTTSLGQSKKAAVAAPSNRTRKPTLVMDMVLRSE